MEQRVAVPRFGNWDKGDNIGYTVYFDNVRKGRVGAKLYNPNDPEENPDLISEESKAPPPAQASYPRSTRTPPNELQGPGLANRVGAPPHEPIRQEMGNRVAQERKTQAQADHGDIRWSLNSPARNDNNIRGKPSYPSTKPQNLGNSGGYGYGELHRRAGVGDGRPENSLERSPLHHHGKASGRGPVGSPARENFSNQSSHGTPGRSRMRPISQGDGNFDRGAALPRFGDWDVNNPSTAGGYTQIFNKVREEKQQQAIEMSPARLPESPYNNGHRKHIETDKPMGGCCFPWGRK